MLMILMMLPCLAGRLPADADNADDAYVFRNGWQGGCQVIRIMIMLMTLPCLEMVGRESAS